jgi:hypothetical protein
MKNLLALAVLLLIPGKAHAVLPTDRVQVSTVNASSLGFSQIVPAQGAGVTIQVVSYQVSCSTNAVGTLISFAANDNAAADIITSTKTIGSSGLLVSPYIPNGIVTVPANKALGINLGTSGQSCGADVQWIASPY